MVRKGGRLPAKAAVGSAVGVCGCGHAQHYHKQQVGPCWYPVKLRSGAAKPETCGCREYQGQT